MSAPQIQLDGVLKPYRIPLILSSIAEGDASILVQLGDVNICLPPRMLRKAVEMLESRERFNEDWHELLETNKREAAMREKALEAMHEHAKRQ